MNAFKNFNRNYSQHLPNHGKIINELLCFLKWKPDEFVIGNTASNLDMVTFFQNLNDILLSDSINFDFLWPVVEVIDIAIKNEEIRQYLVDSVRIITGISNFVTKACNLSQEKQKQLWLLVENITTDIEIVIEEPHVTNLIDNLVTSIKESNSQTEVKELQVSTLTNLCFNNEIGVACLLRFTKTADLLNSGDIKDMRAMRVLWCKLAICVTRFDCNMLEFELLSNLKSVFEAEYFTGLIRSNNQLLLRHILELLNVGLKRDEHSRHIMQEFDFHECINETLTFIDNAEHCFANSTVQSLFFKIVNSILSVSNTSIETNVPRLLKLAIDSANAISCSSEALKTIRLIASNVDVSDSKDLVLLITRLIDNIDSYQNNVSATSEIYKLLNLILVTYPIVINQLPAETIYKSIDTDKWSFQSTQHNLSMQIYRLRWLVNYSSQSETLSRKLTDVMTNKDVHYTLASGLQNSNEEICALTMKLIRSDHFPLESVSQIVSNKPMTKENHFCQCKSTVEIVRPCFSAALEKRVDFAVDQLMHKLKDDNLKVGSSEHVRVLEYQNSFASSKEKLLQSQLQTASDMITVQTNEIGGLRLMIRNYQNRLSVLESQLENSKEFSAKLSSGYELLLVKYNDVKAKLHDLSSSYGELSTIKNKLDAEINELKVQFQKDHEKFSADLLQLKNEKLDIIAQHGKDVENLQFKLSKQKEQHDREKKELSVQHGKDLESQLAKHKELHDREKKELNAQHGKDLESYSAKAAQMKNNYEREKSELSIQHMAKLAKYDKMINKYTEEISKKDGILAEKEKTLQETVDELKKHKENADLIAKLLNKK